MKPWDRPSDGGKNVCPDCSRKYTYRGMRHHLKDTHGWKFTNGEFSPPRRGELFYEERNNYD